VPASTKIVCQVNSRSSCLKLFINEPTKQSALCARVHLYKEQRCRQKVLFETCFGSCGPCTEADVILGRVVVPAVQLSCRTQQVKNILAFLFLFIRLFLFCSIIIGGQPLLLLFCAAARTKRRNGRTRWKPPATCPALGSLLGRITSSEMPYLG